jgi:hypothetical protein
MLAWLSVALAAPWAGGDLVRETQHLHDLPVEGASTVHTPSRTYGTALPEPAWRPPSLSAHDALAVVSDRLAPHGLLWAPRAHLAWRAHQGEARLAWSVDAGTRRPLATLRTWVDAHTGELLATTQTSHTAQGRVYALSPSLGEPIVVDLEGLQADDALQGRYTGARSCDDWTIEPGLFGETSCHTTSPHAVPDAEGNYLFDPDPGSVDDPFAEVHAYHHVDRIARWMDDRFDFDLGYPIQATVNFPMANAFYGDFDGDGESDLSFGHVDESGVDFGYDADVVYHEYGHAIVDALAPDLPFVQADDFGMEWVAGSVHEGAADLWSMLLTDDPLTGEYAGSAFERPAIRDLEADRTCPWDLDGEVHADGEILGSMGWNLIQHPDVGPDLTADLLYGALGRLGATLDWPIVGQAFLDAADELRDAGVADDTAHAAMVGEITRAGLPDCGRVVPMDDGGTKTLFLLNGGLFEDLANIPAGVQLSLDVPEDVDAVEVAVTHVRGSSEVGWVAYGRAGEPVGHETVGLSALGLSFATATAFDWRREGDATVVLGRDELPLGDTLYLSFASRNRGGIPLLDFQTGVFEVTVTPVFPPVVDEEPRRGLRLRLGRPVRVVAPAAPRAAAAHPLTLSGLGGGGLEAIALGLAPEPDQSVEVVRELLDLVLGVQRRHLLAHDVAEPVGLEELERDLVEGGEVLGAEVLEGVGVHHLARLGVVDGQLLVEVERLVA